MSKSVKIEALWDNKNFKKGLDEFNKGLTDARKKGEETGTGTISNLASMVGSLFGGNLGGAAAGLSAGISAVGIAAGVAVAGVAALGVGIAVVASQMKDAIVDATAYAGRVQELTLVSQMLGQRQGYTQEQVEATIQGIRDQGITADVAAQLVSQFSRYNLDLAQATQLATVAQDAAVLSGRNSSETLDQLLYGVLTYNKRVLRTQGLNVDVRGSYEAYAESVNKTSMELTEQEKIQAVLNATLTEGGRIQGAYAMAMESPSKQWRSAARDVADLQLTIGEPFLQAWLVITMAVREFLKTLNKAFSEGGALRPILLELAAAVTFVAETITGALGPATETGIGLIAGMANAFSDAVSNAFVWGFNLVAEFATGIIEAGSSILTAAINYVSKLLSYWFAPGSPPRVAPDIDEWGTEAMSEFLHGFTAADFDVLGNIKSPLKDAIGLLVDDTAKATDIWADTMKGLIAQLSEGEVGAEFYDLLRDAAGEYGEELVLLAEKQMALADAETAVTDAEKRLEEARKREEDSGMRVNQQVQEYNDMLRAGASKEALAQKMKQINASIKERDAAKVAATQAEADVDARKEQLEIVREQLDLQKKLVDQLLELAKAQKETDKAGGGTTKEPKTGGGRAGGGGAELEEMPVEMFGGGGLPEIGSMFDEGMLDIKSRIGQAMTDLWAELKARIWVALNSARLEVKTALMNLGQSIANSPLGQALIGVWDTIRGVFGDKLLAIGDTLTGWWTEHGESIRTINDAIGSFAQGIFIGIGEAVTALVGYIANFFAPLVGPMIEGITKAIGDIVDLVTLEFEALGEIFDWIAALFSGDKEGMAESAEELKTIFAGIWDEIVSAATNVFQGIVDGVNDFIVSLIALFQPMANAIVAWGAQAIKDVGEWFVGIGESIGGFFEDVGAWFAQAGEDIWTAITDAFADVGAWFTDIGQKIWDGITGAVSAIGQWFEDTFSPVVEFFSGIFTDVKDGVTDKFEEIKTNVTDKFEEIKTFISDTITSIKEFFQPLVDKVKEVFYVIGEVAAAFIEPAKERLAAAVAWIGETATNLWNGAKELVAGAAAWIVETATKIWDGAVSIFNKAVTALVGFVTDLWSDISEAFTVAWGFLVGIVTSIWDGIKLLFETAFNAVAGVVTTIWEFIKTTFTDAFNAIVEFITPIWEKIKEVFSLAFQAVSDKVTEVWGIIKTTFETVFQAVSDKVTEVWGIIKTTFETVFQAVSDKVTEVWDIIKTTFETVFQTVSDTVSDVWSDIETAFTTAFETVKGIVTDTWADIESAFTTAITNVKGFIDGLVTDVKTAWENLKTDTTSTATNLWTDIETAFNNGIGLVKTAWENFKTDIETGFTNFTTWISDTWDTAWAGLQTIVEDTVDGIIIAIEDLFGVDLPDWLGDWLIGDVSVNPSTGQITPRERGGPVEAGESYIVGEKRPELFVPKEDGYIYPLTGNRGAVDIAARVRDNKAVNPITSAASHVVTVSIGTVTINNATDLRTFEQSVLRATRRALSV